MVTATLPLMPSDELGTSEVEWNNFIEFDVGDTLQLSKLWWLWQDDTGQYLWRYNMYSDSQGHDSLVSPPMHLRAQAKLQLFDQTAAVFSDIMDFTVYFYMSDQVAPDSLD